MIQRVPELVLSIIVGLWIAVFGLLLIHNPLWVLALVPMAILFPLGWNNG